MTPPPYTPYTTTRRGRRRKMSALLPIPAEWGSTVVVTSITSSSVAPTTTTARNARTTGGKKKKRPEQSVGNGRKKKTLVSDLLSSVRISLEMSLLCRDAAGPILPKEPKKSLVLLPKSLVLLPKSLECVDKKSPQPHVTPGVKKQQDGEVLCRNRNNGGGGFAAGLVGTIRSAIQAAKTFNSRVKLCELNLDTVLSSTSYRSLMKQVFGSDGSIMPGTNVARDNAVRCQYEDKVMVFPRCFNDLHMIIRVF